MFCRIGKILLVMIALCYLSGCGYKEGVLVKDPVSYLWFTGNVAQATVMIDDQKSFAIDKGKEGLVYYQIPPGTHRIIVKKDGAVVVDRVLLIGNGTIKEIQIP